MDKRLKVAIYARVSTSHHDQRPEVQIADLRRFCDLRGWLVTHELIDHGYTGSNDNRPQLQKLLKLARTREIDGLVVVKLDRLFRSLKHLVTLLDEFQSLGVVFVATKDSIDYSTPQGRLLIQILGSLAEFEKSLLRERTLMGLEYARSIGKKLGRPKTTNDEQIRELRDRGLSYRAIQRKLGVSKGSIWRALVDVPESPHAVDQKNLGKSGGEGE